MNDLDKIKFEALQRAKKSVNGSTCLAAGLDGRITPQAISQWRQVPAGRVLDVERVTGVPRHELRPDIYPESITTPEGAS